MNNMELETTPSGDHKALTKIQTIYSHKAQMSRSTLKEELQQNKASI